MILMVCVVESSFDRKIGSKERKPQFHRGVNSTWNPPPNPAPIPQHANTTSKKEKPEVDAAASLVYNSSSTQTENIVGSPTPPSTVEKDHHYVSADPSINRTDATDMSVIDIDTEMRLKSLNLRIKGQIQTIRTLESQLQESLEVIDIRNKQLKQEQSKTAMLEKKLSLAQTLSRPSESGSNSSTHVKNAEQLASKYKVIFA